MDKDLEQLLEKFKNFLLEKNLKLGLAESMTGGLFTHLLTKEPGASNFFKLGITPYSYFGKLDFGVPKVVLQREGTVSLETTSVLVELLRTKYSCPVAIGITGVAGPDPVEEKPIGYTCIVVSSKFGTLRREFNFEGDRTQIQLQAIKEAINMFFETVAMSSVMEKVAFEGPKNTLRLFIACKVSEELKNWWSKVYKELSKLKGIKLVEPNNLHITIKFIGTIKPDKLDNIIKIVEEAASYIDPFKVETEELIFLPKEEHKPKRVFAIEIPPKKGANKLKKLARKVEELMYGDTSSFAYLPHITLGRIKDNPTEELLIKISSILAKYWQNFKLDINNLLLFKSTLTKEGPIYEILHDSKLGKKQGGEEK